MIIQHANFGSFSAIRYGHHTGIYNYGSHIHQFCELIWVIEGEIEMTVEGKVELVKAGQFTVISPFQLHSFYTPEYCHIWICVFSNDFILDLVPFEELCRERQSASFTPSEELINYIRKSGFEELVKKYRGEGDPRPMVYRLKSIFHLIISEYFSAVPPLTEGGKSVTLQRILIYIFEHYRENITQSSVGKALGYSPKYISNCFAALSGTNFRAMLNSLRIEQAKNLLIGTERSMLDIALECGFSGDRSFYRTFVDTVGITPGEYRKTRR